MESGSPVQIPISSAAFILARMLSGLSISRPVDINFTFYIICIQTNLHLLPSAPTGYKKLNKADKIDTLS